MVRGGRLPPRPPDGRRPEPGRQPRGAARLGHGAAPRAHAQRLPEGTRRRRTARTCESERRKEMMSTPKPEILAWHFLPDNGRLRYGARELVEVGKPSSATGTLGMCTNGMHASKKALHALEYAPGSIVCRVALSGQLLSDTDKICARRRRVLAMGDASTLLHEFACWCAS